MIDFQNRQPSVKKSQKLQEIKDQFDNIMNEGAISIHKKLEELIKLVFTFTFYDLWNLNQCFTKFVLVKGRRHVKWNIRIFT